MGETREIAEWIAKASYTDFPSESVECAKGLLLKTVTGMVVGSREPIGRILINYFSEQGGAPVAGIVGSGYRTTIENAAFAHGTFAHASELEDDRFQPGIIGDYWVLPAFFALGEKMVCSGKDIIEASIVAWETDWRMCRAGPGTFLMEQTGISPPNWFGVVAVAAGAAKMLKMDADQIENALSIACSHSCGLAGQLGFDAHFIESGHTCRMGLMSAFLARGGATGRPGMLERHDGLYGPIWKTGKVNFKLMTEGLGKPPYDICNAWIKKFPCCYATHTSVDALIMLMKENNLKYEDIAEVETKIDAYADEWVNRPFPDNLGEARFSIQYVLAEVLLKGKISLGTFHEIENLTDPKYKEAMGKVKTIVPSDWPVTFQASGQEVTVIKKDGTKLVKYLKGSIGSPHYPMSLEQIRDVSRPYLDEIMTTKQRDRVEEEMLNLEKNLDIRELMDLLTFFRNPAGQV